tara:strand:+ start:150 stop:557 length:408 start_codon:yes stop_codon:yes gene_type:complete
MRNHTNRESKGESAFGTTYNKGYFMNINGYRISVQFGTGNYVDADVRYGRQKNVDNDFDTSMNFNVWQSNLAEVMIDIIDDYVPIMNNEHDSVFGWCTAECVAKFIGCIASAQPGDDITAAINQIYQSNTSKGLS